MDANPKLDRIDINILAQLQTNGGLTNVKLAEAVGLSATPCARLGAGERGCTLALLGAAQPAAIPRSRSARHSAATP